MGGSTLGQHDTTLEDIVALQKLGTRVIVVHGGGKIITEWSGKLGASAQFVQGERVTDKVGLEVATAVLAGLVNKELVGAIMRLGGKAIGLSGVDGGLLQGKIKDQRLGYVGSLVDVDVAPIMAQLLAGFIPVISSVSLNVNPDGDAGAALLNVNADTAAGEIAAALAVDKLVFMTDVPGVCDKGGQVIPILTIPEAENAMAAGVASGGMLPKIRASIRALERVKSVRIVDGRQPHALRKEIESSEGGTTILAEK